MILGGCFIKENFAKVYVLCMLYTGFPGSPESVRKALDELTKYKSIEVLADLREEKPVADVDLFEKFS